MLHGASFLATCVARSGIGKQVANRLLHLTQSCNMSSWQLVSQLGLQRLHKVELGSTFYNDCMDTCETIAGCSTRLLCVTCHLQIATDFFSNVARQVARHIAHCNTSLLCAIVASLKNLRNKLQRGHVTGCNLTARCETSCKKYCIV